MKDIKMFQKIKSYFFKPTSDIYIRFNTKNTGPEDPMVWRVFIDDVEHLASSIDIYGWVFDKVTYENDVKKLNIACTGRVNWRGTCAEIQAGKRPDLLS